MRSSRKDVSVLKKIAALALICLCLLAGGPAAEAVGIAITAPSAGNRILAPTRDFYVIVSLDREGKNPEEEPFNVRFELYRNGNPTAIRSITSSVDGNGLSPAGAIETDYANGWTPGTSADILAAPLPDLVFNPAQPVSKYHPERKAVVTSHYAAALIQGGCTKNFDSDYAASYVQDIEEGNYTLTVTAVGGGGLPLDTESVPLAFGSVPDKILSRFSPADHMAKVTAFAAANNSHVYTDLFPGYWDAKTLPHGTAPSTLFYEIVRRWRPNDALEYMNGTVRGVVYNVNATSATQAVEIGALANALRLGAGSMLWYHYDIGDPAVKYNPGNGSVATKQGSIVAFASGDRLVLTRAEIRGDGVTEVSPADYVCSPDLADKQVDWNVADGVAVKPKQLLSLFGAVMPIQPDPEDVVANEDGTYTVNNRIATVRYSLLDGATEVLSFDAKRVELTRYGVNSNRASIYEFRHDIPVPASFDHALTVNVSAFDSYGVEVEGTSEAFVLRLDTSGRGSGGGGGCSAGFAPLSLFLLLPLLIVECDRRKRGER
jgi:Synergist-CTERM protein sorting domain-containing protein